MTIKRSNDDTNQGQVSKGLSRGQTLVTPLGKDSSDYSGSAAKEVPAKMKMAGGIHDYSKVRGKD